MRVALKFGMLLALGGLVVALPNCTPDCADARSCGPFGGVGGTSQGGGVAMGGGQSSSAGGAGGSGGGDDVSGTFQWSRSFGDVAAQSPTSVATDQEGNIVVAGRFGGTVDFGTGPIASGGERGFLAKFDGNGVTQWVRSYAARIEQVAVTDNGSIVLAGWFSGNALDFGDGPIEAVGFSDVFVAMLSPSGELVWVSAHGDSDPQFARDVVVAANGDLLLTGTFEGAINFGGATLTNSSISTGFLVRLKPDGTHIWSRGFPGGGSAKDFSLAELSTGDIVLTGVFGGSINLGGSQFNAVNAKDTFLASFDSSGSHLLSAAYQTGEMRVAAHGSTTWIGTQFTGNFDIGGAMLSGTSSAAMLTLDESFMANWGFTYGDDNSQDVADIAVAPNGHGLVAMNYSGSLNIGGGAFFGSNNVTLARMAPSGNVLWAHSFGDADEEYACALATGPDGSVVMVGVLRGTVGFGGNMHVSAGGDDIFIAKFAP